jgi:hypothetical protein
MTDAGIGGGIVLAATLAGTTGFGFNILSVPILTLAYPARDAVVMSLGIGCVVSAALLFERPLRKAIDLSTASWLFGASLLGLPFGILVAERVDSRLLKLGVGLLVCAYPIVSRLSARATPPRRGRRFLWPAGFASGVMSVSTGLGGPPVVIFMHFRRAAPETVRATLTTYFVGGSATSFAALSAEGFVTRELILRALLLAPLAIVGVILGRRIFAKLATSDFAAITSVVLVMIGVANVAAALRLV